MGGWADDFDFYGDLQQHVKERRACRWLLEGNGRKCINYLKPQRVHGPDRAQGAEHDNLVEVAKPLAKLGFITIGPPDYFGWRWVDLTDMGRDFARDTSEDV